jgi:RNA polymerase sigma factor (sigma-70 family)
MDRLYTDIRTLSDEELHARYILDHDQFAAEVLLARYQQLLECFARTLGPGLKNDACEVASTAVHKTLLNKAEIQGRNGFKKLVFTIAFREAMSVFRARKTEPSVIKGTLVEIDAPSTHAEESLPGYELKDHSPSLDETTIRNERIALLRSCIDQLKSEQKAVAELLCLDFTYIEIAEILQMRTRQAVEKRIERAIPNLKKCLQRKGLLGV